MSSQCLLLTEGNKVLNVVDLWLFAALCVSCRDKQKRSSSTSRGPHPHLNAVHIISPSPAMLADGTSNKGGFGQFCLLPHICSGAYFLSTTFWRGSWAQLLWISIIQTQHELCDKLTQNVAPDLREVFQLVSDLSNILMMSEWRQHKHATYCRQRLNDFVSFTDRFVWATVWSSTINIFIYRNISTWSVVRRTGVIVWSNHEPFSYLWAAGIGNVCLSYM